jgi:small basic protein
MATDQYMMIIGLVGLAIGAVRSDAVPAHFRKVYGTAVVVCLITGVAGLVSAVVGALFS